MTDEKKKITLASEFEEWATKNVDNIARSIETGPVGVMVALREAFYHGALSGDIMGKVALSAELLEYFKNQIPKEDAA